MENPKMQTESKLDQTQVLVYSRSETDNLLAMYAEYMILEDEIKNRIKSEDRNYSVSFFVQGKGTAKPSLVGSLKLEQDKLSDRMKFQNPLIWMMYKYEAYKDNPEGVEGVTSPILTLAALREHAKKDGMCGKRYNYINAALRQKNQGEDLNDDAFVAADTNLADVIKDQRFVNLALDPAFMAEWVKNENDEDGKWGNYKKV